MPDSYLKPRDLCGDQHERLVSQEMAGVLDLTVELPPQYVFQPLSLNTGLLACGDQITVAQWDYLTTSLQWIPAVHIARAFYRYETMDVSRDRISERIVGGRPAIVIEPIEAYGGGMMSAVIFPESFGMTRVRAAGLSLAEILKIVGRATK